MDDVEDGGTLSLYQDGRDVNWPMTYGSHGAMARYGNYDSFSDDSTRSHSNDDNDNNKNEMKSSSMNNNNNGFENVSVIEREKRGLLDKKGDLPNSKFGEAFMGKYSNYHQKMGNFHVWSIVFVKSLDHIGRKFFEYFAYFLAFDYFNISSFYMFAWCVAAIDFSAILSMFFLPFVIDKSPKKLQIICQSLIGKSIIAMAFWKGFVGLFILRFVFGLAYSLLLSVWSFSVSNFIPQAKQRSAASKIELSWAIASFSFILVAWVLEHDGVNVILYVLGISSLVCACLLGGIMPSSQFANIEYDSNTAFDMIGSMFGDILFGDLASVTFLLMIGLMTFTNMMLTICLAPWFIEDYQLTLTEFGYTTVILGTAQLTSIIFSRQFGNRLGTGWSMIAGILVQVFMFILLLLFNNNGVIVSQFHLSQSGQGHYTFPLLIILLFLCIHYIAAEFTFINASNAMMQIAPSNTSQSVANNCLRLITSSARIVGAIMGALIWQYGAFKLVVLIGSVCLCGALILGLLLMSCLLKDSSVFTEIHIGNRIRNENDIEDDDYSSVSSHKHDEFDLSEMKRFENNNLNKYDEYGKRVMMDKNNGYDSEYEDSSGSSLSDDEKSFVNEKLDVQAILTDIDNYQHNASHVNNLRVL